MRNPFHILSKFVSEIGTKRSSKWSEVRKNHLKKEYWCRYCGGQKNLQVHHIVPFHEYPQLELEESNLITLCENMFGPCCHLKIGHNGNWKDSNPDVAKIAIITKPFSNSN